MFFVVENIQKSFNDWERLHLLMAGTLCPPSLLTTPNVEDMNLKLSYTLLYKNT